MQQTNVKNNVSKAQGFQKPSALGKERVDEKGDGTRGAVVGRTVAHQKGE